MATHVTYGQKVAYKSSSSTPAYGRGGISWASGYGGNSQNISRGQSVGGAQLSRSAVAVTSGALSSEMRNVQLGAEVATFNEREEMKSLNNKFAGFITKVRSLEGQHTALEEEINRYKGLVPSSFGDIYSDDLAKLRKSIEVAQREKASIELLLQNAYIEVNQLMNNVDKESGLRRELQNDLAATRNDIEDAKMAKFGLEGRVDAFKEEINYLKLYHTKELQELHARFQELEIKIHSNPGPDLEELLEEMRRNYVEITMKNQATVKKVFSEQIGDLQEQAARNEECRSNARAELCIVRKKMADSKMEFNSLQGANDALRRGIKDLEQRHAQESHGFQETIGSIQNECYDLKNKMAEQLRQHQELMRVKMALDLEISQYRRLLEGEESRVQRITSEAASIWIGQTKPASSYNISEADYGSTQNASTYTSTKELYVGGEESETVTMSDVSYLQSVTKTVDETGTVQVATTEEYSQGLISIELDWQVKGGTVRPVYPFEPQSDAEALHKAMKGLGTDEKTIIDILSNRTKDQRDEISTHFHALYNKDLLKELEGELSGNLKHTVQHLMWKRSEVDAQALRHAIKGFGTDEAVLIEILCTKPSSEISDIKTAYNQLFQRDLVNDVKGDTSGGFKAFLLAILECKRAPDTGTVDAKVAETDAAQLHAIGVKNWTPSNPTFLEIFTQRSHQHLRYLFKHFWPQLSATNLLVEIAKLSNSDLKRGFETVVRFSTCPVPEYYAIQAHKAIAGVGTEDQELIYIVTSRCEIDMIDIKEEYLKLYKKDLPTDVAGDTSGDYKKILLELIK